MRITQRVKKILDWYESDNPGTKANLARILMEGKLGGTGKLVILPVDQGFEHGPARSFAPNPPAYDPHYHFQLAIEAGLSAYAAPLGMIEAGADSFAGAIPTILKLNSSNSLATTKDQAVTGSVNDALRLGCSAIGFTIYPGSEYAFDQMEEFRELADEAKSAGLAVVLWSYPRGPALDKAGETAVDICAYAAHMAALLGAHIIKVKPPTGVVSLEAAKKAYIDPATRQTIRNGARLGDEYQTTHIRTVVERLTKAGLRLSEVLNADLVGPKKDGTKPNAVPAPHFDRDRIAPGQPPR